MQRSGRRQKVQIRDELATPPEVRSDRRKPFHDGIFKIEERDRAQETPIDGQLGLRVDGAERAIVQLADSNPVRGDPAVRINCSRIAAGRCRPASA